MSIYCYLCCIPCREIIHAKDSDSKVFVYDGYYPLDPLSQFLEKHRGHELAYVWEDDHITLPGGHYLDPMDWPRFALTPGGYWSCGKFIQDGNPTTPTTP
jgi:hypothetical protein